jgi:N-acetylmuramoyl-L-alanine amidase
LTLAALAALLIVAVTSPLQAQGQLASVGEGKIVFIDPGHGGPETGAVHVGKDGKVDLIERDLNLAVGLKLRALLEQDGFKVAMSRTSADSANTPRRDWNEDGRLTNRDEYQAVVDRANESGADLFVSIHHNGSPNKEASGTEVWFSPLRAFADKNLLFARLLQANLVASIRATGYNTVDRGIKDDSIFRFFNGRYYEIFVLGEANRSLSHPRAGNMPAALGEALFLSNEADAAMLAKESTLDAIAQGYRNAIVQYFERLAQGGALEWPVPARPPAFLPPAPAAEPAPTPTPTPTPVPNPRPVVPWIAV